MRRNKNVWGILPGQRFQLGLVMRRSVLSSMMKHFLDASSHLSIRGRAPPLDGWMDGWMIRRMDDLTDGWSVTNFFLCRN